jgi:triphosphatase
MEIELKFSLTAAKRKRIEQILAARGLAPSGAAELYRTTYFDTLDFAVTDAGYSLRVRQIGRDFIQTLKGNTDSKPTQRLETEWRLKSAKLDTSHLIATPMSQIPALEHRLSPLFVTDIRRTIYRIPLGGGSIAELAIDQGQIRAGDARQAVHELEIELKKGSLDGLYRFAVGLHAEQPLEIKTESKGARGYRLIGARLPQPQKTDPPKLRKNMKIASAIRTIVNSGIGHLLANLPSLRDDIESLHQARVAIRRLRSALVLFEDYLEPRAADRFQTALRRFGQILGDARDLDVFVFETIPRVEKEALDPQWIALLTNKAKAQREQAYGKVGKLLGSAEFTGFILTLAAWIEGRAWIADTDEAVSAPQRDAAPKLLDTIERKALRRGRHIARSDGEELHALRKTLKKLRYSVDYLAGLYPEKKVGKYLHACKKLQKILGDINDMATTDRLVERLCIGDGVEVAPAVGLLAEWTDRRRQNLLADLPDAWKKFEDASRFWA